jgi:hypothetical protein
MWFWPWSKKEVVEKRYDLNVSPYSNNSSNLNKYSISNDYEGAVKNFRFELEKYCNQASNNIKLNFDINVNRKTGESVIIVSSGRINTSFFNFGNTFTNGLEIHILFQNGIVKIDVDSYYSIKKNHTLDELYVYDIVTTALFNNINNIYKIFSDKLPSYPRPDSSNSHLVCQIYKSRSGMLIEKTNLFALYVNAYLQRKITKFDDNNGSRRLNDKVPITHILSTTTSTGVRAAIMIKMNDYECITNPKTKHKVTISYYYDSKRPELSDPNLKTIKELIEVNKENITRDALKIYGFSNNGNISVDFYNKI